MSSIWDEIKNLPDLKPYVYGLKKEYDDRIKELENHNGELMNILIRALIESLKSYEITLTYYKTNSLNVFKLHWKDEINLLEQIKQKPIEEILKEYDR